MSQESGGQNPANQDSNGQKELRAEQAADSSKQNQFSDKARDTFNKAREFFSRRFGHVGGLVTIAFVALAALAALFVLDKILTYYLTRGYVEQIGDAFGLNKNLVRALVLATFVVVVYLGNQIWSFSKKKRMIGMAGIFVLLVGHSLMLWWATREHFFSRDGIATKCYVVTRDGSVSYGERIGIDPVTGRQCRPVTTEMLERLREYEKGKRPLVITSNEPVFFEPRTGEPVVWYYRSKGNGIEIFDLMGFHPETGEELVPVDKQVVEDWKAQTKSRLARVPKQVDPKAFAFFDARTGTARAWFWRDKAGRYEFFDSPGFHPLTGQTLLIITPDVAEEMRSKVEQRAPKLVDIKTYAPFDPQSGEARLWYSRDDKGQVEFFDAPGFHPRTGVKLNQFTKNVMEEWQRDLKEQQEKLEREHRQRAEEAERNRQEQAAREAADRERQANEQRRLTKAASECDALAANANDPRHVGPGVSFDGLKARAKDAVSSCELAVEQNPGEARFKYQLARALFWTDRARSFPILQTLARDGYPAAYDNLGWLYLTERKNPVQAIQLFKEGMARGDSDSMVSLVEMIDRGHLLVENPVAEKASLLCRAGQLGHQAASISCQTATAAAQQAEIERAQQQQAQRMMLQFMGGVLNGVQRR